MEEEPKYPSRVPPHPDAVQLSAWKENPDGTVTFMPSPANPNANNTVYNEPLVDTYLVWRNGNSKERAKGINRAVGALMNYGRIEDVPFITNNVVMHTGGEETVRAQEWEVKVIDAYERRLINNEHPVLDEELAIKLLELSASDNPVAREAGHKYLRRAVQACTDFETVVNQLGVLALAAIKSPDPKVGKRLVEIAIEDTPIITKTDATMNYFAAATFGPTVEIAAVQRLVDTCIDFLAAEQGVNKQTDYLESSQMISERAQTEGLRIQNIANNPDLKKQVVRYLSLAQHEATILNGGYPQTQLDGVYDDEFFRTMQSYLNPLQFWLQRRQVDSFHKSGKYKPTERIVYLPDGHSFLNDFSDQASYDEIVKTYLKTANDTPLDPDEDLEMHPMATMTTLEVSRPFALNEYHRFAKLRELTATYVDDLFDPIKRRYDIHPDGDIVETKSPLLEKLGLTEIQFKRKDGVIIATIQILGIEMDLELDNNFTLQEIEFEGIQLEAEAHAFWENVLVSHLHKLLCPDKKTKRTSSSGSSDESDGTENRSPRFHPRIMHKGYQISDAQVKAIKEYFAETSDTKDFDMRKFNEENPHPSGNLVEYVLPAKDKREKRQTMRTKITGVMQQSESVLSEKTEV